MRQPMLFIDRGNGWENVTGHSHAPAGLAGFTVDWGTDSPDTQPDPSVLRFQLLDRTGDLAGNSTRLAGMKVLVQLSRRPLWRDLNDPTPWAGQPEGLTWADFHLAHKPTPEAQPDPTALTIFIGNVTSGGTITQRADNTYMLDLYANALQVRMNRATGKGPTSSDAKLAGLHWTGTAAQRADEINRRLSALGCPPLDPATLAWLKTMPQPAAYSNDSYPELSTVLYALGAHHPDLPVYYERHVHGSESLSAVWAGRRASITLHADGTLTVAGGGLEQIAATGDKVTVDDTTLTIPDTVSQVKLSTKTVKWDDNDNKLSFEDDEIDLTGQGLLPSNLTATVESVSFDSDAVTANEAGDHWTGGVWQPTAEQRTRWAEWLAVQTLRLRPEKLTASSRHLDLDVFEQQLQPTASLWAFVSTRYTKLLADDGTPATSGAWLAIGGTLSFDWQAGEPVLANELTLTPLPMLPSTLSAWRDLDPINLKWSELGFTWGEFSQITYFQD